MKCLAIGCINGPRIVASDDTIKAHLLCSIENCGKFDLLIAAKAGIGSTASFVLGHKVLYDVVMKFLGHIPDIERNTDDISGTTSIMRVFDRATATCTTAVLLRI